MDRALARRVVSAILFVALIVVAALLFMRVPTSFVPPEDQGYIISSIMLPDAATLQRTAETGAQLQQRLSKDPVIDHMFVAPGRDFIGGGNRPNAGTSFILLKHWDEREKTAPQLAAEVSRMGFTFPDGIVIAFNPPAIRGLGTAGGFEVYVQARADSDPRRLAQAVQAFTAALGKHPDLQGINTFFARPCRSSSSKSIASRRWRSAFPCPTSSMRFKARWGRST